MALDANALSALIVTEFGKLNSGDKETDKAYDEGTKKLADAIAKAVVTHIKSSAQVVVKSGVTACSAGAGTITSGVGTIQ